MILSTVFLFSVVYSTATAQSLIDKWGRCKITDPNLDACLSKACANMFRDLRPGNSKYGIPQFEPFKIQKMVLKSGGKGPVNLELVVEDIEMAHITDFTEMIVDASQLKNQILKLRLIVPTLNFTAKYKMSGNLMVMPIKGAGNVNTAMYNARTDFNLTGKLVKKEGKSYWVVDKVDTLVTPDRVQMYFSGLFGGDQKMVDAANKALNDNWKLIHAEFTPYITSEWEREAKPLANKITQLEPFDQMFPK